MLRNMYMYCYRLKLAAMLIVMDQPSLMICFAATAEERWMGSMNMLSASEPEIMEKRSDAVDKRSDTLEKLEGEKT